MPVFMLSDRYETHSNAAELDNVTIPHCNTIDIIQSDDTPLFLAEGVHKCPEKGYGLFRCKDDETCIPATERDLDLL